MARPAGFGRRVGAMLYDTLILAGLLMLLTALLLPFTGGEAIGPTHGTIALIGYRLALALLAGAFFVFFWTFGGQTLGMLAWRLRVVRADGTALRMRDALRRLAAAVLSWLPLGLGYLWALFDRDRRAWHDRWSDTRLVVIERASAQTHERNQQARQ